MSVATYPIRLPCAQQMEHPTGFFDDMNTTKRAPGPKGLPFIGSTLDYIRDPLGFLVNISRKYGDIAYYTIGPYKIYMLNNPDYIKDVLVTNSRNFIKGAGTEYLRYSLGEGLLTSEGDFHLRQRRLAQPAFHRQRIAAYGSVMPSYAARLRDH